MSKAVFWLWIEWYESFKHLYLFKEQQLLNWRDVQKYVVETAVSLENHDKISQHKMELRETHRTRRYKI